MFNTFEELKTYTENMEQTKAYNVGPYYTNHQRAVYQIGLIQILIDTVFPHNIFKPTKEWYWTGDDMSKEQAESFAHKYNARVEDSYYSEIEEKQLIFDNLDDLLHWIWDNKRKELNYEHIPC